jgi:hypothetical protein
MPANISVSTPVQSVAITENSYSVSVVGDTATVSVSTNTPAVSVVDSTSTFTISTIATKTDVGLGSVDNTSDADKPISTATQTALNLKANAANPSLTGTATLGNAFIFTGDFDTRANRPTFKSNTGTTTGFRLLPPSNTTNNLTAITAFTNTDINNADIISIGSRVSAANGLRIQTAKYTSGTIGSTTQDLTFLNNTTIIGTINYTGTPTNLTDLTTKTYVDQAISSAVAAKDNTDEITEGSTNLYFTTARARSAIGVSGNLSYSDGVISYNTPTTSGINEGTNLYHTTARARASVSGGTGITYSSTDGIINVDTTTIATRSYVQGQVSTAALTNTDGLAEGTTNLYYTNTRARAAVSAGTGISYNNTTGVITNTITQYTDALARGAVSVTDSGGDGSVSYNNTTGVITYTGPSSTEVRAHLSAGTGLTYTTGQFAVDTSTIATRSYADSAAASAAAAVVDAAPGTLDTLNELAAALGDDPNYATTITTALGNKLNTSSFNTTADGWLAGKTTTNLTEGTNLYYTDTRARGAVSAGTGITYSSSTGVITNTITQYTDALARGAISVSGSLSYNSGTGVISYTTPTTDGITEGSTNLYYTTARARSALSAGTGVSYNSSTGAISIGQAVGTTDNPTFGTITANLATGSRALGQMYGTQSTTWTPPATGQTTMTGQNGFYASSSSGGANGYGSTIQSRYYSGDTTLGTNTTATFVGGAATGTNASPTALASGQVLVSLNADGYATTGWAGSIATGTQTPTGVAILPAQLQFYSREAFADNGTNVTAGGTGMRVRLFNAATTLTAANRVNIIDHTTTTATYKAATFNIQPAASTSNYAVFAPTTGSINQDTFTIKNNAATSTQATFNSTGASFGSGSSTYASFTSSSSSIGYVDSTVLLDRTTAGTPGVANQKNAFTIESRRSDQAGVTNTDQTGNAFRVGGTGNFYWTNQIASQYMTGGDHVYTLQAAAGDQTSGSPSWLTLATFAPTQTILRAGTAGSGGSTNSIMEITNAQILNNRPYRNAITTATITEGSTYTPAATDNNSISLTINTGSGTTIIDLINLTGQGTGGMYTIMVFNNAATGTPINVRNTRIGAGNLTTHTIPSGERIMVTAYIVGDYATSEHLVVA